MLNHLVSTLLAVAAHLGTTGITVDSDVHIRVDSARQEVVISAGPLRIPAMTLYAHHAKEEYVSIQWPVSGWMRGYRVWMANVKVFLWPENWLDPESRARRRRRRRGSGG